MFILKQLNYSVCVKLFNENKIILFNILFIKKKIFHRKISMVSF